MSMLNATVVPPAVDTSYWAHVQRIGELNSDLSKVETMWAAWYAFMQDDVLATGIMSFTMHEVVYFGRSLPWILIDAIPYFRRWKLQDAKIPSAAAQWRCTKFVLLLHFTVELPQIWVFHPLMHYFGMSIDVPFPTWQTMAAQIILFFFVEDAFHYWLHRLLHWGPFYKYIHKVHHEHSAPFGLAAEYASPLEVLFLGLGTVGTPILYCAFTANLHLITMYTWIILRLFQAIDAHSGYFFPWSLQNFIPFWGGASYHDVHHERFIGNYSSSFRIWDWMMDTEAGPEAAARRRDKKRTERDALRIKEQEMLAAQSVGKTEMFASKKVD